MLEKRSPNTRQTQRTLWAVYGLSNAYCPQRTASIWWKHILLGKPTPSAPLQGVRQLSGVLGLDLFPWSTSGSKLWRPDHHLRITGLGYSRAVRGEHRPQNVAATCRAILYHPPASTGCSSAFRQADPARKRFQEIMLTPPWKIPFPPRWDGYSMESKTEQPFQSWSQHTSTSF